jgi:outer membrane murein-binding lipoprotein Lpp
MCHCLPRSVVVSAIGGMLLLSGCSLARQDQLEASLRKSEANIRQLEQKLTVAERQLQDQESELQVLRESPEGSPFHHVSSARSLEAEVAWGSVQEIRVHSLASGVLKTADGVTMNAVIQPLDGDGEVLKVAGELTIKVQNPGETSLLGEVSQTALESRSAWSNGIVARGFQFQIELPQEAAEKLQPNDEVLVTAILRLNESREFKATQLLRVPE